LLDLLLELLPLAAALLSVEVTTDPIVPAGVAVPEPGVDVEEWLAPASPRSPSSPGRDEQPTPTTIIMVAPRIAYL
jgi:hypothetical protein